MTLLVGGGRNLFFHILGRIIIWNVWVELIWKDLDSYYILTRCFVEYPNHMEWHGMIDLDSYEWCFLFFWIDEFEMDVHGICDPCLRRFFLVLGAFSVLNHAIWDDFYDFFHASGDESVVIPQHWYVSQGDGHVSESMVDDHYPLCRR